MIVIALWFTVKLVRLVFELYMSKKLRYLRVTLPRNDSKLDKEHETKKDFKEKIGMMSMFYKAMHKLSETGFRDTVVNSLFNHAKVSLELVYDKGQVSFYVVTFEKYVSLVSQHITSIYTDAEVLVIDPTKDYVNLKEKGYKLRCASLGKEHDYVFPIKTYKSLEDDPLNNFTNVF